MGDQTKEKMQSPDQLSDMLLALDNNTRKIKAVKGIDKDGGLKTVEPIGKNQSQFMRIDKHGNLVSNFLTNFFSQLKDPTRFSFYRTSAKEGVMIAGKLQKYIDDPSEEGTALLKKFEVKSNYLTENPNKMEKETEYRYQPEQVDWKTMSEIGLSKEKLEKMNLLEPMLRGYKTNELVPIYLNLGVATTRMDARLSLQANDDGQVVIAIHGIRKEPRLDFPFFGHEFSKEDKKNLLKTGNMGRVVELTNPRTLETAPSIVSVDRLTNELIALRVDRIKIPDEIKGVALSEQQKETLMEGKPLYLEGMISKKGEPFSASVQFNADKRYVEFLFDRGNNNRKGLTKSEVQRPSSEVPRVFRGKELDDEQYSKFKSGETVHVSGLIDKKGKEYQGYITFNKDTAKTGFTFDHPDKLKEKAVPTESHKTQVAVNSEGKTNEATKGVKEPLKSEQKEPDSKKQQAEQEESQTPAKSRGRKM